MIIILRKCASPNKLAVKSQKSIFSFPLSDCVDTMSSENDRGETDDTEDSDAGTYKYT